MVWDAVLPLLSCFILILAAIVSKQTLRVKLLEIALGILVMAFSIANNNQNSEATRQIKEANKILTDTVLSLSYGRKADSLNQSEFQRYLKDTFGIARIGNTPLLKNIKLYNQKTGNNSVAIQNIEANKGIQQIQMHTVTGNNNGINGDVITKERILSEIEINEFFLALNKFAQLNPDLTGVVLFSCQNAQPTVVTQLYKALSSNKVEIGTGTRFTLCSGYKFFRSPPPTHTIDIIVGIL